MKKLAIAILAVATIAVIVIINPFKGKNARGENPVQVSTAVITRGDLVVMVNSSGIVEPIVAVELKSKASGEIITLPIEEGDAVTKGQLIAILDTATARNDYNQAQADLDVSEVALSQAQKQAERQKQMFDQGLISELDYETAALARQQAYSNLVQARVALEYAKEKLSDTVIRSPIDGIILKKYVEKGQIIASGISAVSGGTAIATVADMSKVYVRTSVDEVDIGQIAPGQEARVTAESYPDREFSGLVLRVHPQAKVDQNVTTFDVTIEVDNSARLLMAGMNATVEIVAGHKENLLLVPREALTDARTVARMVGGTLESGREGTTARAADRRASAERNGNGGARTQGGNNSSQTDSSDSSGRQNPTKMVIVIANGQQVPQPVEIGLSNFEMAEVVSGLNEGDTVLTTVTSKALKDREQMLERMRGFNQLLR